MSHSSLVLVVPVIPPPLPLPRKHEAGVRSAYTAKFLGIGAAVARAFASSGCSRFAITDINDETLAATHQAILKINPKAQVMCHAGDVSNETFVESMMTDVTKQFRRVDYAVHCAGILGNDQRSTEMSVKSFDAITNVNYKGTWLASRAALRQMLQQQPIPEHPQQRGSIVNIASQLGIVARPGAGKFFFNPAF